MQNILYILFIKLYVYYVQKLYNKSYNNYIIKKLSLFIRNN